MTSIIQLAGFLKGNIPMAQEYVTDIFGLLDLYQDTFPEPGEEIEDEIEEFDLEFLREDLPKLIKSMDLGIERIKNISTSLRTFSRADKDCKTFFNLHEGIDSTILILKHRLKANETRPPIKIIKDYAEVPPRECFPGQLNQVFMNIIANGIDALEENSQKKSFQEIEAQLNEIKIKTDLSKDQELIHISDNGMGMTDEVKERIFENLYTTKGVGKGTGLGLAIAKQIIVEKHGEQIEVNSSLGEGKEFVLTIPIKDIISCRVEQP
ncbi:MAG: HAMP domain-containing histidine kinase [Moorea sp. SIO2B7]|nr:HAMP domain-containing histidine kinase [Moorena sp. SIO2B7]